MIPWFASASPRTWEKPSASGYFLCICSVSDVQVHSIAAPCRSSSAHSSSHKPTNCHMTAQRNKQICPFEPMGTCDFECIHRQNAVSRAPRPAALLTAPEATWIKCSVPCSCCRLQRHTLSSWTSQQGLVLCGTAGLQLHPRPQWGFWSTSAKTGRAAPTQHLCTHCSLLSQVTQGGCWSRIKAVTVATAESQQHSQLNENLIALSSYLKVVVRWGEVSSPQ